MAPEFEGPASVTCAAVSTVSVSAVAAGVAGAAIAGFLEKNPKTISDVREGMEMRVVGRDTLLRRSVLEALCQGSHGRLPCVNSMFT